MLNICYLVKLYKNNYYFLIFVIKLEKHNTVKFFSSKPNSLNLFNLFSILRILTNYFKNKTFMIV